MLRGWKCLLVVAVASFAFGCTSPTLPLPPPVQPSESAGTDPGTIHLHGVGVEPDAIVLIINNYPNASETLTGQQKVTSTEADAQGTWDADNVHAVKGDVLQISQLVGDNDESASIDFTVN